MLPPIIILLLLLFLYIFNVHTFSAQHSLKKFLLKKSRISAKTVQGKDADHYPGKGELVYITRSILDESIKIVSVPFKQISLSV